MVGCILDKKTLWVVSAGAEAVPGLLRAKEMGLHLVVSDASPSAPGVALADDFVQASTYDVEESVEVAAKYHREVRPIDGVICLAADVPLTVASVTDTLGLPGISVEAARLASDKLAMKDRFVQAGVPVPWYSPVDSVTSLRQLISSKGLPLVIKPVDSRGARGVLRLTSSVDPVWAFRHARSFSPTGRVMVEEYLEGPQVSTESMLLNGQGYTPGFSDRNYEYLERFAPYIIENGGHQPSVLSEAQRRGICRCAEEAGRAMGITTGIAKGDMVWTSEGPKVIEMAARLSGGWFSSDQIPLATGVDLVGAAIRLALGEEVTSGELIPVRQAGVAIRYFFPAPGRVISIQGVEEAEALPGIHKIGFFVEPGDVLESAINHTKRAGYVITHGASRDEAIDRAMRVVNTIYVETEK